MYNNNNKKKNGKVEAPNLAKGVQSKRREIRSTYSGSFNALSMRGCDIDKMKIFDWIVREKDELPELTEQNLERNLI